MRSAGTCVVWRCVWVDRCYVLTFGSGGVRSDKDYGDFRLPKLRSVKSCHIACCVHHTVFRLLWLNEYVCWEGAGDLSSWGVGQGSSYRTGRGWVQSDFLLKTFEDGLENFALGTCVDIIEVVCNTQASKYAQHLATHRHAFANIQGTMQILEFQKKCIHHNTVEGFCIYKEVSINNHLNDTHTVPKSKIFETILKSFQEEIR